MKSTNVMPQLRVGLLFVALLFAGVSCEDYLQDELLSDTSAEFLYNTPEGLESAVVGLYSLNRDLYEQAEWNYARALIPQAKSDLVLVRTGEISLYGSLAWGAELGNFGTGRLSRYWRHYYRLIDRSNAVITSAQELEGLEESRRDQIIAEARVFRAHSYFTLYRQFNNIFITTEPTSPDNAFDRPDDKSSPEEIFALINEDLDFAIENLDWNTPQFGRLTQAAARHIRAKTAAWQEDWAEAASQADAVINEGNYNLLPNTADVFFGDLNHEETLFTIQFEEGQIGGSTTNRIHFNLIPQYNEIQGVEHSLDNGARGAGFILLNNYLRGLLNEDPNDDRNNGTYYITHYTYNNPEELPEGVQLGDTVDVFDQNSDDENEFMQYYAQLNPGTLKFLQNDAVPSEANQIKNLMIYRLAETYLIGAEAHMEMGSTGQALEYINAVRNRANAASISSIDQQAILDERARELALEGQRWYTLKRMGVLVEQIRQFAGNDNFRNQARERIQPFMGNWPIPTNELNLLGPNYPQNEGH
jgi:hypothetical protein